MPRKIVKFTIPLLVVTFAVFIVWYLKVTKPVIEPTPVIEKVWTIASVPAKAETIRPQIRLFGEIVSGRTIDLRSEVAGKVVTASLNLVEGGVVKVGEVLVEIDKFDYAAALKQSKAVRSEAGGRLRELRSELSGAVALIREDKKQLALRKKDAGRKVKLRGSGAGTAKSVDDARLAASEAEQRLIDRKREIERLKATIDQQSASIERLDVSVSKAERDLDETRIIAPSDGFVFSVETAEGKWLNVGDSVARLIDASRLEAKFHISRTQFRRLISAGDFKGRSARVVWRGRSEDEPYLAKIDRVSSEIDAQTGGIELYAKIKTDNDGTILRPGAFVEVFIDDHEFAGVFRLPLSALYEGNQVYVVTDGRLKARRVDVKARIGDDVLVVGELVNGDTVAVTRLPEAAPGLQVRLQ